ncbi:hypothetical protein ACFTZI_15905 [Streptomyces decoyicus]|uniref:MmyB family transcriptional regulator n=1 Tax=Streptomyces decoyicus TaxID=249567 RepID=UPI003625F34B
MLPHGARDGAPTPASASRLRKSVPKREPTRRTGRPVHERPGRQLPGPRGQSTDRRGPGEDREPCQERPPRAQQFPTLVAKLRSAYGRHAGEPARESPIGRLSRADADFARPWEAGDVSPPGNRLKVIQHASVRRAGS